MWANFIDVNNNDSLLNLDRVDALGICPDAKESLWIKINNEVTFINCINEEKALENYNSIKARVM